jgi:hypothetical protein
MCLARTTFKLEKRNGRWIGVGYKCIRKDRKSGPTIPGSGRFDIKDKHIIGKWQTANKDSLAYGVDDDNNNVYPGGFHILLSIEDAKLYATSWACDSPVEIREVFFEEVLAYGIQSIYARDLAYRSHKGVVIKDTDCIIARRMKVGKVVV